MPSKFLRPALTLGAQLPKRKKLNKKQLERRKKVEHLSKTISNAETLISQGILRVVPETGEAFFPRNIWDSKDEAFKQNIVSNVALYLYSINVKTNEGVEMAAELYDFENNALASYVLNQPVIYT